MPPTLVDYHAALERATQDAERARARRALAEQLASEFGAAQQRLQALVDTASPDFDTLRRRLQLALSPAADELRQVVADELERVTTAEAQLARAHERLRRAEQAAAPGPRH